MDDALTMGASATMGFVFQHVAELTKAAHSQKMERHAAQESSMEKAAARGGKFLRYGIYLIVAFSLVYVMVAGGLGKNVVLEYQLDRKFLFFEWTAVKLKDITGVVLVQENRTAFLAMISFLFGKGAR